MRCDAWREAVMAGMFFGCTERESGDAASATTGTSGGGSGTGGDGWAPLDERPGGAECVACADHRGVPSALVHRVWKPIDDSPAVVMRRVEAFEWRPVPAAPAIEPGPDDLDDKAPPCPVLPLSNTATNHRFLFLREIGGPACLIPFLENIILLGEKNKFWGGTLIIDQEVVLDRQLVVPDGFTLAGVGINGGGRLRFTQMGKAESCVKFDEKGTRGGTIRDLVIEGPGVPNFLNGVKLGLSDHPGDADAPGGYLLRHVRVAGFGGYGVQGGFGAFGVNIDTCQIVGNSTGIQLIRGCDAWRIRDSIIDLSTGVGVDVGLAWKGQMPEVKGALISGCKISRNREAGIRINEAQGMMGTNAVIGTCIFGNRFETNNGVAIDIRSATSATRIISNFFVGLERPVLAGEDLGDPADALGTHIGFNAAKEQQNEILNTVRAQG